MAGADGNHDLHDEGLRDDDLRERFVALRREDEALAPEFAGAWAGRNRGRRRSAGKLVAIAVCVVTIAAGVWLRIGASKPEPKRDVASISEWKAPTDFLLNTPGQELLRTVPTLGTGHDYAGIPGAIEKSKQGGRQTP